MNLDDKLREIDERAEMAYYGPWVRRMLIDGEVIIAKGAGNIDVCSCRECDDDDSASMMFIAHARTDIPALLRLVDVLRKQRDDVLREQEIIHEGELRARISELDAAALAALEAEAKP
jgi:hypothetical protein